MGACQSRRLGAWGQETAMKLHDELTAAAWKGELNRVRRAVESGADVNSRGGERRTAVMEAAGEGHLDVVKCLVELGADVNASDNDGETALMKAAGGGRLDVVKCLVELGADVNAYDNDGATSLLAAAYIGDWDVARFLVDHSADVNSSDDNGETAMMWATFLGQLDVAKFFVDCGANVNARDNYGDTTLMKAVDVGNLNVVKYLVDSGATVNATDNDGDTALIKVAFRGHLDVVKYLVDCGADVKAANNEGLTAAAVAAQNGHLDIHHMLTQHSARSAMSTTEIVTTQLSMISTRNAELFISPFDISVTQTSDSDNTPSDFVATWLDADVALKLFVLDATNTTFYEEVTLWHRLRHPNVIKLYGACDVGHNLFVCELASNRSVVDYLKSCPLGRRRPWRYLLHAALGLAYLHERGIVHGDLRGSNILVGEDDQAKLANFGLSGTSSSNSENKLTELSSRGFVGSWRWQSPELLEGKKPSYASDMYALGLCAVEMLIGEMPWNVGDQKTVWMAKRKWEPETDQCGYWPANISGVCRQLLKQFCCRDPSLRQSALAGVRLLKDLARQEEEEEEKEVLNSNDQVETIALQDNAMDIQYWLNEIALQWIKIQDICTGGAAARTAEALVTTQSYPCYQRIMNDLTPIIDATQKAPQQMHLIEQLTNLLSDVMKLMQNSSQASLVIQLSSTRATGSSVYALRRRVMTLKRQFGIHEEQNQHQEARNIDYSAWDDSLRTQETQIFISEISKTWLILDELETNEERSAFLAHLYSETNERGSNYSAGQCEIMQRAYDDLKCRLDGNEDFVSNRPVWFVPWYELAWIHGSEIGSGGFGSVCLAKWLDSAVVVKRIRLLQSADDKDSFWTQTASTTWPSDIRTDSIQAELQTDDRNMFAREAEIWFNLSHPHVVRLFGACHVGSQPFFVCEYASNGSLEMYLLHHPDEIWTKLHEAALGILYLHERGIVHCDLMCNNIVVGTDRKAKVTDFGLSLGARGSDNNINEGENITGAWNWLAPELMLGDSTTPTRESDVFSFGMCIVEALRVVASAVQAQPSEDIKLPLRVP